MPVTLPETEAELRERVVDRIGELGLDLRIDDDIGSLTAVFNRAWTEILGYASHHYSATALATSEWIMERWTDYALAYLCQRRLNSRPGPVVADFERAEEWMKKVLSGDYVLPDIGARQEMAPRMSNQRVVLVPFPHVVTERAQSTGKPGTIGTNDDPHNVSPYQ